MKKRSWWLALLAPALLPVALALAQTSDYQIIEGFKKSRDSLSTAIKEAKEPSQVGVLDAQIGRLEGDYSQHRKLLADGLYPGNLDTAVEGLREQLKKTAERIAMVEESKQDKQTIEIVTRKAETAEKQVVEVTKQNVEYKASIDKLMLEVQDLSAQVQKLTDENNGLVREIKTLQAESKRDKESIAKLQQLTAKLNQNIRDRDELIIKMMDGMFTEYAKAGLSDVKRKELFVNAQGNDYVGKIVATVDGNIAYAENTVLSPQDLKTIREEQGRLAAKWEAIKPQVAKIYPDEQSRTRDLTTVDARVAEWSRGIDVATWKGVRQVFVDRNVPIGEFANGTEFHARLTSYLDAQIANPSRETHAAFKNTVWNTPLKDQWLPVIPLSALTQQQRADIESRVASWDQAVAAMVRRWLMIGAAVVALIVVVAVLAVRSRKPAKPTGMA